MMKKGTPPVESLRVAAAQMRFAPTIEGNLELIEKLAAEAARRRADAVLFPECAVTGYNFDFAALKRSELLSALGAVGRIAGRLSLNLLVGAPVFRRGKLYNCLVVFNRQGVCTYCYAKNHLTPSDELWFKPGNAIALFEIDDVSCTSVICHERRYPELVRLAVMAGAKILFHPNAGMDALAVSRTKRGGRDGVVARAFENAIYYVFANSVGPQAGGKWSAGDSKIVGPDERYLQLADNQHESVVVARLDLRAATGVYAQRGFRSPPFLTQYWQKMVEEVRHRAGETALDYDLPKP
jgi:predicted amidohydrolase